MSDSDWKLFAGKQFLPSDNNQTDTLFKGINKPGRLSFVTPGLRAKI